MLVRLNVEGYKGFKQAIAEHAGKDTSLFFYFSGSKDDSGKSWCPDCVAAEPIVEEGLASAPEDSVFVYCSVGDRAYWKNPDNDFRKDENLKLTTVPTLIKWDTVRRLEEDQCRSAALVTMLFEE